MSWLKSIYRGGCYTVFFLMMLPFVKGLMVLYAFGVTFMAIIAYALHSPDMAYQIGKAIIVNVLIWLLMLQHYYGLLMPKAPD